MIDRVEKKDCAGCGACAAVCPKDAICLREDGDGFRYPEVDAELCVQCGRCEKACPALTPVERHAPQAVYAACAKEDRIRMQAASGGAFTALAESFLRQGGAVYGCAMASGKEIREECLSGDGEPLLCHIRAADLRELQALSGSRYAQSRTEKAYRQIRQDLAEGRRVLYGGTPCQVAGLRAFLAEAHADTGNLFTADILCHGVPSERLLRQYLTYLEKKYRGRVTGYQFRDKERGFTYYPKFRLKKGGTEKWHRLATMEEGYWYLFQNAMANRENCYSCPYAASARCGDVSLGDYWGIEQAHPELLTAGGGPLPREKGISLLLVNTGQGQALLESCGELLDRRESTLEKAMVRGDALKFPTPEPEGRTELLEILRRRGYAGAAEFVKKTMGSGYARSVLKEKIKQALKRN